MTSPTVGMAIEQIETPALIVDLEAFEDNLDSMRQVIEAAGVRLRAHAKTHKSVDVARLQIARGGVCGICVQKTAEAEVMVAGGIADLMVSNQVTVPSKISRLAALTDQARIYVCADDSDNIAGLSSAMAGRENALGVLVEIDVGNGRCGVEPGTAALRLARQITAADGLHFAGLQAYQGNAQHIRDPIERAAEIARVVEQTAATVALLEDAGLPCPIVAGAGTGTFPFEAASGIYNEVQCGSYVFMDADYKRVQGADGAPLAFHNALYVLTSVMSVAGKGRAVCDAGHKAASLDSGLPVILDRPDLVYNEASDEHGVIDDPDNSLSLNQRLWLIPGHCDPTVNLHRDMLAVRAGRVEAIWPVSARGMGT
jgi:3-hydroxy-D-aspartate aldolase